MGLDRLDWEKLDKKFGEIHSRITASDKAGVSALNEQTAMLTEKINGVGTKLDVHIATPCPEVVAHVKDKHDIGKQVGIFASVCGIASAIGAGLMWFLRKAGGG
jgi:hypothetical protein